jgi:hypothetical protein
VQSKIHRRLRATPDRLRSFPLFAFRFPLSSPPHSAGGSTTSSPFITIQWPGNVQR